MTTSFPDHFPGSPEIVDEVQVDFKIPDTFKIVDEDPADFKTKNPDRLQNGFPDSPPDSVDTDVEDQPPGDPKELQYMNFQRKLDETFQEEPGPTEIAWDEYIFGNTGQELNGSQPQLQVTHRDLQERT